MKSGVRSAKHLLISFLFITLVLVITLTWLGRHLLKQDRALEKSRIQERLDTAADLTVTSLRRRFSETEEQFAFISTLPDSELEAAVSEQAALLPADSLFVILRPQSLEAYPSNRLLYYPFLPVAHESPENIFMAVDTLEFGQRNYGKTITLLRELGRSKDTKIRAGAMLRLARNLRKIKKYDAALATYNDLSRLSAVSINGLPVELLARYARCNLLEQLNQLPELNKEVSLLYSDLYKGRWQIDRATYRFYTQEIRRWLNSNSNLEVDETLVAGGGALALASAVESLWQEWQRIVEEKGAENEYRDLWIDDHHFFLFWRSTPRRLVALVAGNSYFRQQWLDPLEFLFERQSVKLGLTDAAGYPILSEFEENDGQRAVRTAAETQLPWTLYIISRNLSEDLAQLAERRYLIIIGMTMTGLVVVIGIYFIAHAARREMEVVRLQSGFVAAVSHEFRSPLTSVCQLTELLASDRVPSRERRQKYYQVLMRESRRLHRFVESLLDFGRMDAGAHEYRPELLNMVEVIRDVVEEFQQEIEDRGYRVELTMNESKVVVRGDREALRRALWNLLDNAVKYSPDSRTIWVKVDRSSEKCSIVIRDQGLGIPVSEQKEIFQKFVRGTSSKSSSAAGTGIGLAMVHQIVTDHNGKITVGSDPGRGSAFTVQLPLER